MKGKYLKSLGAAAQAFPLFAAAPAVAQQAFGDWDGDGGLWDV